MVTEIRIKSVQNKTHYNSNYIFNYVLHVMYGKYIRLSLVLMVILSNKITTGLIFVLVLQSRHLESLVKLLSYKKCG